MARLISCSLQFVLVLGAALIALSAAKAETTATLNDPVAYCRTAGTIDAPDAEYKGPAVPDWMVKKAYPPEAIKAQKDAGMDPKRAIVWRCASGAVLMLRARQRPAMRQGEHEQDSHQGDAGLLRRDAEFGRDSALRDRARDSHDL
jgi:hypothetical protein